MGHEHTCIVNVQGNKWNQGDEGSFAINLGVYFPVIADLGGGPQALGRFPRSMSAQSAPGSDLVLAKGTIIGGRSVLATPSRA